MSEYITVQKGRTVTVAVNLVVIDEGDTFSSEIRSERNTSSVLIATWEIDVDVPNKELTLTLDNSITEEIEHSLGYMDIKRITDGEPVSVFNKPLEVRFEEVITA